MTDLSDLKRERLIQQLVDDILDGHAIGFTKKRTATTFLEEQGRDASDLAMVITGRKEFREINADAFRASLANKVREWCEGPGAEYVTELLIDREEDARAEAKARY